MENRDCICVCERERTLRLTDRNSLCNFTERERERVSLKAAVGRRMQDRGSIYKKFVIFILYFLFYY